MNDISDQEKMVETTEAVDQPEIMQPAPTPAFKMLRTLGLVATMSGLLVVMAFRITEPMIEKNKQELIERAMFKVIPGSVARRDFVVQDGNVKSFEAGSEGTVLYAGYDENNKLKGLAMETAAPGYQDVIRILYGYDPYCQCIRGIEVLKMAETPGIGDKIIKDENFVANFDALDASLNTEGNALANPIVAVKAGSKTEQWQIDSISGATISSKAVAKMLDQSSQQMAPIIQKHLSQLEVM